MSAERNDSIEIVGGIDSNVTAALSTAAPPQASLFEPVRDRHGWRLALVFGNHAPGGRCPFFPRHCLHCDIGGGEGVTFDHAANQRRLAWFAHHYRDQLDAISHLVLYNSGSILNPREMPSDLLVEILAFARSLPAVETVSLDSRETFIKAPILKLVSDLFTGLTLRPILGIEASDDRLRDQVLQKAMPRQAIDRVFADLGTLARELGPARIGLDVNIVIAGPGTSADTAVDDAVATARYALESGMAHGLNVDLNLHPYYRGTRGADWFPDHPRCSLATTVSAASAIARLVRSLAVETCVFIGSNDEGHDLERGERDLDRNRAQDAIDRFNQTNEPEALRDLD